MRLSTTARIASIVLVTGLLLGAGCLSAIGEQTKRAVGADEGATEDPSTDAPETEQGETARETRSTYVSAFSTLDGSEEIHRIAIEQDVQEIDGDRSIHLDLLLDASKDFVAVKLVNRSPGAGETGSEGLPAEVLFAQVHKTIVGGTPDGLLGQYDRNETPPQSEMTSQNLFTGKETETLSGPEASEPSALLDQLDEPPEGATLTSSTTTYQGQPATEIRGSFDNGTRAVELRAIVLEDPPRPALIEGTIEDPNASFTSDTVGDFTMRFSYGDDATHPHEDALLRMSTMTFHALSDGYQVARVNETMTRTIQPFEIEPMVALDEVEVLAVDSDAQDPSSSQQSEPVLRLPADQGAASSSDVELRYVDADGDGYVSPGDRIEMTPLTEAATSYELQVHDEVTGMRMAPGPGLLAALAALGAGVALVRRRR